MPVPDLGTIALVAVAALLIAGALAPLEALGWWAGWYGDPVDEAELDPALDVGVEAPPGPPCGEDAHGIEAARVAAPPAVEGAPGPGGAAGGAVDPWVVFLSGVHAVDAEGYVRREAALLERLRRSLPRGRVIQVFPYSVTDRALTGERVFAGLWRLALRAKTSRRRATQMLGFVINLRNVWQVLVSADRRYGPFYNRGSAALIVRALRRRGLAAGGRGDDRPRIVLIGYSGGAQVAAGAAPFVEEATGAVVTVVSLGGVIAADPGLLAAEAVWHLHGRRDRVQRLSAWAFPGRWRLLPWSPWNVARHRGALRTVVIGPCDHTGTGGYLDADARVADGRSYFDVTADVLTAIAAGRSAALPVAA
jgi:hypothetical protein